MTDGAVARRSPRIAGQVRIERMARGLRELRGHLLRFKAAKSTQPSAGSVNNQKKERLAPPFFQNRATRVQRWIGM
jgi:hypothetical protein